MSSDLLAQYDARLTRISELRHALAREASVLRKAMTSLRLGTDTEIVALITQRSLEKIHGTHDVEAR